MDVTEEELSNALSRTRLGIEQVEEWKLGPTAVPSRPDDLANALLMKIRTARDDVVDAHICCEHAGTGDRELLAMAAVLQALAPLRPDECSRVLDWARRRFAVEPPF